MVMDGHLAHLKLRFGIREPIVWQLELQRPMETASS